MKRSLGARTWAMPTPVWVVGTYREDGKPNIMTAAWGGICCSSPPSAGVALQRTRASYANIVRTGAFTISIPSEEYVAATDYAGIASGNKDDKFVIAGLTAVRSEIVNAPYVQEFPLILECRLTHMMEIGVHTQFIGEIVDVKADEAVLDENGLPVLAKINPFIYSTAEEAYYGVGSYMGRAFALGRELKK